MTTKREDRKAVANENASAFLNRFKLSFNDSGRNLQLMGKLDHLIQGANHKHLLARLAKSIIFLKGSEDQMSYANIRGKYNFMIVKGGPFRYIVTTEREDMTFITKAWLEFLGYTITSMRGREIIVEDSKSNTSNRILSIAYNAVHAEFVDAQSKVSRLKIERSVLNAKIKAEEKRAADLENMLLDEKQLEDYVIRLIPRR